MAVTQKQLDTLYNDLAGKRADLKARLTPGSYLPEPVLAPLETIDADLVMEIIREVQNHRTLVSMTSATISSPIDGTIDLLDWQPGTLVQIPVNDGYYLVRERQGSDDLDFWAGATNDQARSSAWTSNRRQAITFVTARDALNAKQRLGMGNFPVRPIAARLLAVHEHRTDAVIREENTRNGLTIVAETNYLGHVETRRDGPRLQTVSFTGTVCSYEDWPSDGTALISIAAKTSEAKGVHVHFVGDEVSIVMVGKPGGDL